MMREIKEDLLQDLQWNGEELKRREELRNHFRLQILDLVQSSSKLPQQDQTRGHAPAWKLKVGQTPQTWRPTVGIRTPDPAITRLTRRIW